MQDPLKTVCIDCRYVGTRPSGIAELVRSLVECAPLLAPDLRFVLLRAADARMPLSDAPNVVERIVRHPANGPSTMWWLRSVVDLSDVDLFHATYNTMPAGLGMPCVVTIHDLMRLTRPDWCRKGVRGYVEGRFFGGGIRRALRSADALAAVSASTASEIANVHPPASSRTVVTMSGVSPRFRPVVPTRSTLANAGVDPDRPFVLTVGQYAPYKNHEGALRGFAAAFTDDPGVDLIFVQRQGSGRGRLVKLARELGIEARVRFLPPLQERELLELYSAATLLLHPSLAEGFGNPIAEAMACGCPVVTSATSAMPDVAGGAAVLVDPRSPEDIGRALSSIVGDAELRDRMRAAGIARAAKLQWRPFAELNVQLYRDVLARSRDSGRSRLPSGLSV